MNEAIWKTDYMHEPARVFVLISLMEYNGNNVAIMIILILFVLVYQWKPTLTKYHVPYLTKKGSDTIKTKFF